VTAGKIYYDAAMRRMDRQAGLVDSLDTKARSALGAASALIPIFGVVFAAFVQTTQAAIVLYGIAFGLYLAMIFFVWQAIAVRGWSVRPDLPTLERYTREKNEATISFWVASECAKSVRENGPALRSKAFYVDLSILALALVTVLLSVAALLELAA
jgi:hypothetical protein